MTSDVIDDFVRRKQRQAVDEDLVQALRALAYAAMTSGGTAGPDVALKDAIRWATDALQAHDALNANR